MYGDMEMIKQELDYSFTGGKSEWIPSGRLVARSRLKTSWYRLNETNFCWAYRKAVEPILAPTILSTWSK